MPSWDKIHEELGSLKKPIDLLRSKYLSKLNEHTGRNVIAYYSGWLQEPTGKVPRVYFSISDADMNAFMATVNNMDRNNGIDLILHTPGGDLAATEAIVKYLTDMFEDIRVVVPQLAMSAGTMIALASDQILMGKHSSLGPIDPQIGGVAAHAIVEEFEQAAAHIGNNDPKAPLYAQIIQKYGPALVGECQKAIAWSEDLVSQWLRDRMFSHLNGKAQDQAVSEVLNELGDHAMTKSHNRHIHVDKIEEVGLNVTRLEKEGEDELQDLVLSVHHSFIQTLSTTGTSKITENHLGTSVSQRVEVRAKR